MERTADDIQDELLVLECQSGKESALQALVARWHTRLSRFAWRYAGDREASRDAVQEAWLAIIRGLNKLDDPARFRVWAYRIVAHKCVDAQRKRITDRTRFTAAKSAQGVRSELQTNQTEERNETRDVRDALKQLSDEDRAIVALYYLDGLGLREIATIFDTPVGTIKSRLHHVRNRLRHAMERMKT
jgi:RNA polymerase sigma-70 factor, ECF subfamily